MLQLPELDFGPMLLVLAISPLVLAILALAYVALLNFVGMRDSHRRLARPALISWALLTMAATAFGAIVLSAPSDQDIASTNLQARETIINKYRVSPETAVFDREYRFGPSSVGSFAQRLEVKSKKNHYIVDLSYENGELVLSKDGKELKRPKTS